MVRVGDRVYHFLDMKNVGTVLNIMFEGAQVHLEGGTAQQEIILLVRLDDGRIVKMRKEDVLKAE
jgi:hypothetical protein